MTELEFEQRLLRDDAKFIESYPVTQEGKHIDLEYWQRDYIRDPAQMKITDKSRRTGWTFIVAAKGLYRSQNVIRNSMPFVYEKHFISRNLNDAQDAIIIARWIYDCLPSNRRLAMVSETKRELIFEDYKGRRTRLRAHTSNDPRGIGGDIAFDEAAFLKNFRRLYAAGQWVTGRGGDIEIGSSPGPASGLFYEIFENVGNKYSNFARWKVPWWLSTSLCTDVLRASIEAPAMSTRDRVYRFGTRKLIEIFETSVLSDFQQESECMYADESSTYFPYELLRECEEPDFGTDAKSAEIRLLFDQVADEPTTRFWEWVRDNCKGVVECGYDVGRTKHVSALVVTDTVNGIREVRAAVILSNKEFGTQEHVINECIKIIRPVAFRFDNKGLGMDLGERLEKRHGSLFERIDFNPVTKLRMATNLKYQLEQREIKLPSWATLIDNIHSIQKQVNQITNNVSFESDSTDHHGDLAWALMLAGFGNIIEFTPKFAKDDQRLSNSDFPY